MIAIHAGTNPVDASYSGFSGLKNARGASPAFGFHRAGGASAKVHTVSADVPVRDDNASRLARDRQRVC